MSGAGTATSPANRLAATDNGHHATGLLDQVLEQQVSPTIYDRIGDPLAFVKEMGKAFAHAGVAGCKTPAEGECLAWALLEMKKNWVEFAGEYHMVLGKPTLQAHAILARIRRAGGKVRWINQGDDLKEASAEFTIDGEVTLVRYTWDDAVRARIQGFDKADSAWQRSGGAMLRAAMSRKAAKMLCPEVLTGDVDPEEFDSPVSSFAPTVSQAPQRSAAEIEQRRKELEACAVVPVVSATSSPVAAAVEPAPFESTGKPADQITGPSANDMTTILLEIEATLAEASQSKQALEAKLGKPLDQLSIDGAKTLLANLRNVIAAKK